MKSSNLLKTVRILTPESVDLEFNLAGVGSRALALLVDYIALMAIAIGLLLFGLLLNQQLTDLAVLLGGGTEQIELWLFAIFAIASFAIYVGYFVFFETAWQGQSPGKRATQIRVIQANGRPPGIFQVTLRSLLRPVDDTLFIGFFLILFTAQEKRIGDLLANTLVVQVEQGQANVAPVKTSEAATPIAHQLEELADLSLMSPSDFVIIRSYLSRRDRLQAEARSQVSLNLAQQTQALIALDTLPSDMTPDVFLEAVYLAYQAAT